MFKKIFKLTCSIVFAFLFFSLQDSNNLCAQPPTSIPSHCTGSYPIYTCTTSFPIIKTAIVGSTIGLFVGLLLFKFFSNNEFSEKERGIIQKYVTKIIKLKKQFQTQSFFVKFKTLYNAANGSIKDTFCIALKYLFS